MRAPTVAGAIPRVAPKAIGFTIQRGFATEEVAATAVSHVYLAMLIWRHLGSEPSRILLSPSNFSQPPS